ncbi:MAG TPA: hypothetical protein PLD47_01420 [Aggregatilineales bacterium]|nr:hypothetical protein [Anaerolineales bacterium]HRE46357.1 hypothetical protein [Aggregatilineales bacterium]
MSFQEKRSIVSLLCNIVIALGYFLYLFQRVEDGGAAVRDDLRFWAAAILILIPVYVVFHIVFQVIFLVIYVAATGEKDLDLTDEFDRMVELKSTRNFYHMFMAGFLFSLGAVVAEQPAYVMFLGVLAGVVAASIVQDLSQFFYYRRGV